MRFEDDDSWWHAYGGRDSSEAREHDDAERWGPGRERGVPFPCPEDITGGALIERGSYLVRVAVDVGEATICWHRPGATECEWRATASGKKELLVDKRTGEVRAERWLTPDEVKRTANLDRANRRARRELRQYCVRNRLSKMWTLTLAEILDKKTVKRRVNAFMHKWRDLNGGKEFPYLYVLELHADGERWHVHVAVPNGYTDKHKLQELWGLGLIRFDESPRRGKGTGAREQYRRLAAYLAKYISKSIEDVHEPGEHRYERAQGFGVEVVRRSFAMFDNAESWLVSQPGGSWIQKWSSDEIATWDGPPAWGYEADP